MDKEPKSSYNVSKWLWCNSQIRNEILNTTCWTSTSSRHLCIMKSFSFLWTSCDCFGTFMQLIMYTCLWFPTLSVANVMLRKMYYIVLCAIVLPRAGAGGGGGGREGASPPHSDVYLKNTVAKWIGFLALIWCYYSKHLGLSVSQSRILITSDTNFPRKWFN